MELVNRLMGEVEKEERAAEEAKEETALSGLDILAKVEERKQTLLQVQEANNMVVNFVLIDFLTCCINSCQSYK